MVTPVLPHRTPPLPGLVKVGPRQEFRPAERGIPRLARLCGDHLTGVADLTGAGGQVQVSRCRWGTRYRVWWGRDAILRVS